MTSSRDLQRRADQARERLSDRLTELGDQLSPSAVIGDLLAIDYDKARQDVTQFLSQARAGQSTCLRADRCGHWLADDLGGRRAVVQTAFRSRAPTETGAQDREGPATPCRESICFAAARLDCFGNKEGLGQGTDPALDRALLRRRGDFHGPKINAAGHSALRSRRAKKSSVEPNARETVLSRT